MSWDHEHEFDCNRKREEDCFRKREREEECHRKREHEVDCFGKREREEDCFRKRERHHDECCKGRRRSVSIQCQCGNCFEVKRQHFGRFSHEWDSNW